ncbi:histidinol dehydrogenase [Wenzhouxiangella sp. AB-CW3]|uniref:histidinol dehydrogenase n=1 Tax=Wenzhouxiangella sp. AB-CW3 TaxID=2771012 RepID=UPI00168A570F|nr:histidinol dehydrogenase [Wenzhouxiangella sp. AB-CW3]QOC22537.1 histidinol dehydrogenase [Wenzhouxiangella sp. AB-CW3]
MKIIALDTLDAGERQKLLARPEMETGAELRATVADIIAEVRARGDAAVREYGQRFDPQSPERLLADPSSLTEAAGELDPELIEAIDTAMATVETFHAAARPRDQIVETAPGVTCQARWQAIDPVGLYVPAGSAPLPSTAIMLAVPARLAGCEQIVLATPPGADGRADAAVRYIARRLGIDTVVIAGGAQAVAAMAFGTESVPKTAKIFGPGNRFVTEAKRQVAGTAAGAAIDLPAGPSEVMVIADDSADAEFVAMDLLSQAEHGPDSQVFLVTDSDRIARETAFALSRLLPTLPRHEVARQALESGAILTTADLEQAVAVANEYAPEHLILATREADSLSRQVRNAGSVFLGHFTPEALGDYISGTNHVLPTGGWARAISGLSITDFMRRMTVQRATPEGLGRLGPAGARLAAHEGLDAHRRAITLRLERLAGEGA